MTEPGVHPVTYINRFKKIYTQLQKQTTLYGYVPLGAKQQFIMNIDDPEYDSYVMAHANTTGKTLWDLMADLEARVFQIELKETQEPIQKRARRATTNFDKPPSTTPSEKQHGTATLPPTVYPNSRRFIIIEPSSTWYALQKDHKAFVRGYNAASKHRLQLPPTPAGVSIGPKKSPETPDSNGYTQTTGSNGYQRQRAITTSQEPICPSADDDHGDGDADDDHGDEDDNALDISILLVRRKARFHVTPQ